MRHFIFIILAGTIFSLAVNAQELKRTEPDLSDYIPLLNAAGYEVFTFDLSSLKDETYNIEFIIREYSKGALVKDPSEDGPRFYINNRRMLSDFPEETQKEILSSKGPFYDLDKGILTLAEKLSIGFTPSADSLKRVTITLENMAALGQLLSLKPLTVPQYEGKYLYEYRPFKVGALQLGDFTPLVLVGSFWYDEEAQLVRFCGENELAADLSSEMLSLIPHYFVIGMNVTKK